MLMVLATSNSMTREMVTPRELVLARLAARPRPVTLPIRALMT